MLTEESVKIQGYAYYKSTNHFAGALVHIHILNNEAQLALPQKLTTVTP